MRGQGWPRASRHQGPWARQVRQASWYGLKGTPAPRLGTQARVTAADPGRPAEKQQEPERRGGQSRGQAAKGCRLCRLACQGSADFIQKRGVASTVEQLIVDQGAGRRRLPGLQIAGQGFK